MIGAWLARRRARRPAYAGVAELKAQAEALRLHLDPYLNQHLDAALSEAIAAARPAAPAKEAGGLLCLPRYSRSR